VSVRLLACFIFEIVHRISMILDTGDYNDKDHLNFYPFRLTITSTLLNVDVENHKTSQKRPIQKSVGVGTKYNLSH
jgi:hypothetical protein